MNRQTESSSCSKRSTSAEVVRRRAISAVRYGKQTTNNKTKGKSNENINSNEDRDRLHMLPCVFGNELYHARAGGLRNNGISNKRSGPVGRPYYRRRHPVYLSWHCSH